MGDPQEANSERLEVPSREALCSFAHTGFVPDVSIHGIEFRYPRAPRPSLVIEELSIPAGSSAAIVGGTGAGKWTLVDLILGIIDPDAGTLHVGGLPPSAAVRRWPGAIGYVPQSVALTDGSIRQNVALGLPLGLHR